MARYTMLTNIGLDRIAQADSAGMHIEITKWVGAFDEKLYDDYTSNNPDYLDIANYTNTNDEYPNFSSGENQETVYNGDANLTSGASRQTNTVYWNSVPTTGNWNTPTLTNLYSGVTYNSVGVSQLDPSETGTWVAGTPYPLNPVDGNWWKVIGNGTMDTTIVGGTASVAYCDGDILVRFNDTFINGAGDANKYRGHFNVSISSKDKILLINKVGLYGIVRSNAGVIQGSPFLLGQVIIPNAQAILPSTGQGEVNEMLLEFQIDAQAALIDFDDIMYASQNDYWKQTTVGAGSGSYALSYEGAVYIAQSLSVEDLTPNDNPNMIGNGGLDGGVAKLLVSTFHTTNSEHEDNERELPQLVLQYVDNDPNPAIIIDRRIRTTFRTTDDGDCEIDMYGACNNEFGPYSFVPKSDEYLGLGNKTNRWKWLEISDTIDVYAGDYITGNDGKILKDGVWYYIDNSDTKTSRSWRNNTTLRKNDFQDLKICGDISNEYGYISLRKNHMSANSNLGMAYFGNTSVFVGPHHDSRDYTDGGSGLLKENYFYTYGNISNYISESKDANGNTYTNEYPFCLRSTQDINLYTISTDNISKYDSEHLSTYMGYDALGVSMEIWTMIKYGSDQKTQNFVANFTGITSGISTIYNSFFTEGDYDAYGSTAKTIQDVRDHLFGLNPNGDPTGTNIRGISRDILFTSSRYIYTFGDIVPMVDGLNDLGSWNHGYRDLHVGTIHGGSLYTTNGKTGAEYTDTRHITIDGSLLPVAWYHDLGSIVHKWDILYAQSLGTKAGQIDTGYIRSINSDELILGKTIITSTELLSSDVLGYNPELGSTGANYTNFAIGSPTSYINAAYINVLHIGSIVGLDTSIKTSDIKISLNTSWFDDAAWEAVSANNLYATVTYSNFGITNVTLKVDTSAQIKTTSTFGTNSGTNKGITLISSDGKGLFEALTLEMKSIDGISDDNVDNFWALVFSNSNTANIESASADQNVSGGSKNNRPTFNKNVKISDVTYDANTKIFGNDAFTCEAKHTDNKKVDSYQSLQFTMVGIALKYE